MVNYSKTYPMLPNSYPLPPRTQPKMNHRILDQKGGERPEGTVPVVLSGLLEGLQGDASTSTQT
jgi:hypothetical protein